VVITTTIVFILNELFFFREFLDIFKRVIVLVVRVLFKAKYETSFS
jgi:predicted component of type VI protein secretion system